MKLPSWWTRFQSGRGLRVESITGASDQEDDVEAAAVSAKKIRPLICALV
jgi:hypothetical protein